MHTKLVLKMGCACVKAMAIEMIVWKLSCRHTCVRDNVIKEDKGFIRLGLA